MQNDSKIEIWKKGWFSDSVCSCGKGNTNTALRLSFMGFQLKQLKSYPTTVISPEDIKELTQIVLRPNLPKNSTVLSSVYP